MNRGPTREENGINAFRMSAYHSVLPCTDWNEKSTPQNTWGRFGDLSAWQRWRKTRTRHVSPENQDEHF